MKANTLFNNLEKDFIKIGLTDDWSEIPSSAKDITEQFKQRHMGLLCDFSEEINQVFTAVFPDDEVMQKIIEKDTEDALLFLHHPLKWDSTKNEVFEPMNTKLLEEFKKRRISIYVLHVPLDNFGDYSTSKNLALSLGFNIIKPFHKYFGALAGVICGCNLKDISELKNKFEKAIGHDSKLYKYGDEKVVNDKVAIVAGGGNNLEVLKEALEEGAYVLLTGVTRMTDSYLPTIETHQFAKMHKINILGGTHYSTEKFACKKMCDYFVKLGLKAEFIPGTPMMEDI